MTSCAPSSEDLGRCESPELRSVVGIGLEGKTKNRQPLPRYCAEQLLYPTWQCGVAARCSKSPRSPVVSHLRQAEMAAEVNKVEDILLETAVQSQAGIQNFGPMRLSYRSPEHRVHPPHWLPEGGNRINRAYPLLKALRRLGKFAVELVRRICC